MTLLILLLAFIAENVINLNMTYSSVMLRVETIEIMNRVMLEIDLQGTYYFDNTHEKTTF